MEGGGAEWLGRRSQSQRALFPQQDTCEHSKEPKSARDGAASFSIVFFFFFPVFFF